MKQAKDIQRQDHTTSKILNVINYPLTQINVQFL